MKIVFCELGIKLLDNIMNKMILMLLKRKKFCRIFIYILSIIIEFRISVC